MLARLLLGFTLLTHVRWFASPLPAFFHLVLAAYVLLFGYVHAQAAGRRTCPTAAMETS